ncbi:2-methylaconitate cis-trans isomerase PrpF [Ramlibacter sp. G-1-2-2]|uniref:2-methylaconitate cis-trans isomerase PrpF n=1 Tax=Ramlibacter agri TaxID=2728837 RepID=A0A848HDN3_9BURK|nr:2-methylaconitate cis-trans isomerase PrpF [Ramlibacter agri]NML47590.1 2-methylaconitate cis-trans isomerase PrpF [Ramlibacter agri]
MKIRATWMRGGTSKGLFFRAQDLPAEPAARDRMLLRAMGSPDPYGTQIDGLGGATPSTSKVVLVRQSRREDCDVEYLFGAVSIREARIDWSGNCGNLTAAVAPFAIAQGLHRPAAEGTVCVRMWQDNIGQRILTHVAVRAGEVVEEGAFALDGVAFPSSEIRLEFLDPGADPESGGGPLFPTGHLSDLWEAPGFGVCAITLLTAGAPTLFVRAQDLGLSGSELQSQLEVAKAAREALVTLRRRAAMLLGLAASEAEADAASPHVPRVAFVAPPRDYQASGGKAVRADETDLAVRILSLGRLHQAMTGTGAVALAVAAAVPGTVVAEAAGGARESVRFGHPSGVLEVGASVRRGDSGEWQATRVVMSRSARRLMEGEVFVP